MKKLFITLFFVVFVFASYCQKVDLDRFNFTFEYRDLPRIPQSPDYKTYSVSVSTSSMVRSNYGDTGLENLINLDGWKKVDGVPGHLIVNVHIEDLIITGSQVTERVEVQKDKDGKETGRSYYYKAEATYTWNAKATVKDFKDAAVGSIQLGNNTVKSWATSEYSSRKEAADYYNNNKYAIRNKLQVDEVNAGLSTLSGWLSKNYGYPARKEYEILWILDAKKHPETVAQKENWEIFKAAVATISPDHIPHEAKEKFATVIEYFDAIPTRFNTDEKGDKKLRYASYYNKAKIYMYLDNPEAAIKEAEALIANGYDDGDGKRIKREAEEQAELLKKNNSTTRHFTVDLSGATPPAVN